MTASAAPQAWIITGASKGWGRALAAAPEATGLVCQPVPGEMSSFNERTAETFLEGLLVPRF